MAAKTYRIAGDSPSRAAEVDRIKVRPTGDPVALTQDQVKRLEDCGVILVEAKADDPPQEPKAPDTNVNTDDKE